MKLLYRLAAITAITTLSFSLIDYLLVDWKYFNRDRRGWLDVNEKLYSEVTNVAGGILSPVAMALRPNAYFIWWGIFAPPQEKLDTWHGPEPYSGNPLLPTGGAFLWRSQGRYSGLPYRQVSFGELWLPWLPWAVVHFVSIYLIRLRFSNRKT